MEEIQSIPGIEKNPIAPLVFKAIDTDNSGEVDFNELVESFSVFTSKENFQSKLMFLFRIYDQDKDGFISQTDLLSVRLSVK